MNNSGALYISALQPRDIKRYPNEITKVPERDSVATTNSDFGLSFPELITAASDEPFNASPPGTSNAKTTAHRAFRLWEKEQFGFGDLVDIINPLQHIPIVATIYRNMSGDQIGVAPRVIGGAVWGRLGGLISGAVNAVVDWFTGKDVGDHVYSALFGTPDKAVDDSDLAQSDYSTAQTAQLRSAIRAKIDSTPAERISSFGAFNDDGGFAPGSSAKEMTPEKEDHFFVPVAIAAANSYAESRGLDEKEEPFRFRFPA